MPIRCLPLFVCGVIAALPLAAQAQAPASAPVAKPAAQAPAARPKPAPNLMSPEEKRDTATHDLQPDRPVDPQVSIPLGKKGGPKGKSSGSIDDAAARCQAEATETARAACRDKAAKAAKSR